jgi:hypothetical protein
MVIARENNEIIIKIPDAEEVISIADLQYLIEFIKFRKIVSQSKASQEEIDELAREVNSSWWAENKNRFLEEEEE